MPDPRDDQRIDRVREERAREEDTIESSEPAGDPELDDQPMGVPPEADGDEEDELPGFPRDDPSHG